MAIALFVVATLIAAALLLVGMTTNQGWLFGLGSLVFAAAFIWGLNAGDRDDHAVHHGH
ncbi:MAG: hypothetical protein HYU88_01915 [Chloroflexi bacterium]|nr:hypothetical protein [Chloroflexota bacterium]